MTKAQKQDTEGTEAKEEAVPVKATEAEPATRRSPAPFFDFDREFERAFENFFKRGWLSPSRWEFPKPSAGFGEKAPNVNLIDRENEIVIEAELPGVSKDDVDVSISENAVTIKASTRREEKKEEGEYHRREISTSLYSRTLPLPAAVVSGEAKAQFTDGVLTVTLPKAEESKRVSISVS
jgi:HSP20 family protein